MNDQMNLKKIVSYKLSSKSSFSKDRKKNDSSDDDAQPLSQGASKWKK